MTSTVLENLEDLISKSVDVSNKLLTDIIAHVRNKVVVSERVSSELLDNYQFANLINIFSCATKRHNFTKILTTKNERK